MYDEILNPGQAAEFLGISIRTLYRRVAGGFLAPPRRLTPEATYWYKKDLELCLGKVDFIRDDKDISR